MELSFTSLFHFAIIILIPYIGYLHRSISDMKAQLETKMTRPDVLDLIDLKKELTDFQYESLREDIEEIKLKLDKIINSFLV